MLKVACINFSSSQLSTIVNSYINRTTLGVCNKGLHKHTKTPLESCSGYMKICSVWISPFGVNIHLFIFWRGRISEPRENGSFFLISGFKKCFVSAIAVMAATSAARWPKTSAARRCWSPARKCPAVRKSAGSLAPLNRRAKPVKDSHAMAVKSKCTCGLACQQP